MEEKGRLVCFSDRAAMTQSRALQDTSPFSPFDIQPCLICGRLAFSAPWPRKTVRTVFLSAQAAFYHESSLLLSDE